MKREYDQQLEWEMTTFLCSFHQFSDAFFILCCLMYAFLKLWYLDFSDDSFFVSVSFQCFLIIFSVFVYCLNLLNTLLNFRCSSWTCMFYCRLDHWHHVFYETLYKFCQIICISVNLCEAIKMIEHLKMLSVCYYFIHVHIFSASSLLLCLCVSFETHSHDDWIVIRVTLKLLVNFTAHDLMFDFLCDKDQINHAHLFMKVSDNNVWKCEKMYICFAHDTYQIIYHAVSLHASHFFSSEMMNVEIIY